MVFQVSIKDSGKQLTHLSPKSMSPQVLCWFRVGGFPESFTETDINLG